MIQKHINRRAVKQQTANGTHLRNTQWKTSQLQRSIMFPFPVINRYVFRFLMAPMRTINCNLYLTVWKNEWSAAGLLRQTKPGGLTVREHFQTPQKARPLSVTRRHKVQAFLSSKILTHYWPPKLSLTNPWLSHSQQSNASKPATSTYWVLNSTWRKSETINI